MQIKQDGFSDLPILVRNCQLHLCHVCRDKLRVEVMKHFIPLNGLVERVHQWRSFTKTFLFIHFRGLRLGLGSYLQSHESRPERQGIDWGSTDKTGVRRIRLGLDGTTSVSYIREYLSRVQGGVRPFCQYYSFV